jgi:hypothetical protein
MIHNLGKILREGKFKISKETERILYFYAAIGIFIFYLLNLLLDKK